MFMCFSIVRYCGPHQGTNKGSSTQRQTMFLAVSQKDVEYIGEFESTFVIRFMITYRGTRWVSLAKSLQTFETSVFSANIFSWPLCHTLKWFRRELRICQDIQFKVYSAVLAHGWVKTVSLDNPISFCHPFRKILRVWINSVGEDVWWRARALKSDEAVSLKLS